MAAARPLTRPALPSPAPARPAWVFPVALAAVLALTSLAPYLLAYWMTPQGHHFGGFFFIADDATTYLAKMRQGAEGSWLWTDPYTSEPHGGVLLFAFYLLAGHLAALAHLPLIAVYHLAGMSGAFVLVLAVDRLARATLPRTDQRLGVALALLASGLGFLVQAAGNPSLLGLRLQALDLHLPELSGWYSILAIPHFVWAAALMVLALLGLRQIGAGPGLRPVIVTGAVLTALAAIHPQMIAVLLLIWCANHVLRSAWGDRSAPAVLLREAAAFAIPAPLLAYNAWILYRDPTVAAWANQWRHQAPDPLSLALSLGIPLAAAVVAIVGGIRSRDRSLAPLLVWPPLVLLILYLPNVANIQRRLLDAIYVPVGLLAAVGLRHLLARLPRRRGRLLLRLPVTASCFSSLLVLAIALRFASGAFPEVYISDAQWQAMAWLSSHHLPQDRVLSSPGVGLYLPADSGVSVYVGHYSETLDYFSKIRTEDAILHASTTPDQLRSFFGREGITLLYWGPDERSGRDFDPADEPFLQRIYDSGGVQIYRLQPEA